MLAIIIETGEIVEVLGLDSDEACAVWVWYPGTDRDAMIPRQKIELI